MKGRGKEGKGKKKVKGQGEKGRKKVKKGEKKGGRGRKREKNGRNIAKWWGRFSRGLMRGGEYFQKN